MTLTKQDFIKIKHQIKSMCLPNLLKLCNEVGLNEYETNLLTCINQDMSRVAISFKLGCSEWKISTDMRKIFTKIMDYTSLD